MATAEYVDGTNLGNRQWEASKTRVSDEIKESRPDIESKVDDGETPFQHLSFKRLLAITSLLGLLAISQLPLFLISGSLTGIVTEIGGGTVDTWLPMVNSLAFAAVAPFGGALSDLIGRRYVALHGAGLVIVGMIIVGTAHRMPIAIAGMTISGVGAGLSQVVGLAGVAELVPVYHRGKYLGKIFLLFAPMAGSSAYAMMYSVTQTWRWGGWIPVALGGVTLALLLFGYHPPPRPVAVDETRTQILSRIDYIGGVLSIAGIALFMLGLQWGGYTYAWRSGHVIAPLMLGIGILALFVLWEGFTKHPMIPRYVFANPRVTITTLFILAMGGANFYALAAFWQLEMGSLYGPDVYTIARITIPFGFAYLIGAFLFSSGIDFSKGAIREVLLIASCMMTAGIGAMAAISLSTRALSIGLSFLGMLGVGGLFVPAVIALMNVAGDDVIGTIAGLGISIRFIGGQVGYTVFFNILQNRIVKLAPVIIGDAVAKAGLPLNEIPTFIGALLTKNDAALQQLPGVNSAILQAALLALGELFIEAFKIVYYASIAFGVAAIIACLFLGNIRKYMTDHVAVDIH